MKPALDKLNGVLTILDNRKERLQKSIKLLNQYAMSLGESVSSGPFFKTYIANLLPGQFLQPFIDAAFSDLGLDPNVLLPSQRTDPQVGQPGTPALPVPFPRTGQGGEPHLTICPTRSPATPAIRGVVRPASRCPDPPAATRTASRCPHRRRADRRRGRPRWRRPEWVPLPVPTPNPGRRFPRPVRHLRWFPWRAHHEAFTGPGLLPLLHCCWSPVSPCSCGPPTRSTGSTSSAYFDNSNGIFVGDDVRILGVPVGRIDHDRTPARTGEDLVLVRQPATRCPPTPTPRSCHRRW